LRAEDHVEDAELRKVVHQIELAMLNHRARCSALICAELAVVCLEYFGSASEVCRATLHL